MLKLINTNSEYLKNMKNPRRRSSNGFNDLQMLQNRPKTSLLGLGRPNHIFPLSHLIKQLEKCVSEKLQHGRAAF